MLMNITHLDPLRPTTIFVNAPKDRYFDGETVLSEFEQL